MPLTALIFDFDGLILDTETPEAETWRQIFREHGCEFPEDWWLNAIGRGAEQAVTLPEDLLEEQLGYALDRPAFKRIRQERILQAIDLQQVCPGVVDLATECRAAGVRVGIASSSPRVWVDGYLVKHQIQTLFEEVVCAEDAARGKPFPDLYLECLRRLGTPAEAAVALEDSPNGIRAAKAAGLICVAVPNPTTARCDLAHADARLESLQGVTLAEMARLKDAGPVGPNPIEVPDEP